MSGALVARMADVAAQLLVALAGGGHDGAVAPFEVADRLAWTYLPGPRPGVVLGDLDPGARGLVMELVDAALSASGAQRARDVMALDAVLGELERGRGRPGWERRGENRYWFRLLGHPRDAAWAWHLAGHHLGIHVTVVGDAVAATPCFLGANPAVVPRGPRAGWQVLRPEESLARDLLTALRPGQRGRAVVSATAPDDIATRRDPVADPALVPVGLAWGELDAGQRPLMEALVRCYLGRVHDDVVGPAWQGIVDGGLEAVTFAWAGSLEPGAGHYYAVRGPTFLVEYDNAQDDANHVHTVWRDLRRDWGLDLLAAHHATSH